MSVNLTRRDAEILRTLVRVQLASTSSLQDAFFNTLSLARKRLALLRNAGFIVTHGKGLPGLHASCGSNYWRITEAGLLQFAQLFPAERIPDNLVARTRRASLRYFEHRDDMTSSYLRLIASQDRDIGELRARADIVDWRGEFEVVLTYQDAIDDARPVPRQLIPDGTLSTSHTRYFVEVDRSTEPGQRIRRILNAYKTAFREHSYFDLFPDQRPASVIYATKSADRARNLRKIIRSLSLPFAAHAFELSEATAFLNEAVSRETSPLSSADTSEATASLLRTLYDVFRAHVGQCPSDLENSAVGPVLMDVYKHLQSLAGVH